MFVKNHNLNPRDFSPKNLKKYLKKAEESAGGDLVR